MSPALYVMKLYEMNVSPEFEAFNNEAMVQKEKRRRKETNVIKHSKPGMKYTDEKGKVVVKTVD